MTRLALTPMPAHIPHPARLCESYDDWLDRHAPCLSPDQRAEAEAFRTALADYAEAVAIGAGWILNGRPHSPDCRAARLTKQRNRRLRAPTKGRA